MRKAAQLLKVKMFLGCMVFAAVFMFSCSEKTDSGQEAGSPVYDSFRDVPDIIEDEIRAIEALQKQYSSFVYGMHQSTEAFYNESGEVRGYSALFCDYLSKLFGITFNPVIYDWDELTAGFESGEIDFTGRYMVTEERRMIYLMTDTIAERWMKFMRLAGSASFEDIAVSRRLRYAFLSGSITLDLVAPLSEFPFETILVDDYGEAYDALKSGAADAFFDDNTAEAAFDIYDDIIADDFFPFIYGPISLSAKNPAFEPVISVVQKILQNGGKEYFAGLYELGQREYMRQKLFMRLTDEEKQYLRTHSVIPFGAEFDNYPVSFYNTNEKEWQGIVVDVLHEVELLIGLSFERKNDQQSEFPVLLKMLEDGDIFLLSEVLRTREREGRFVWPETGVMEDFYALISTADFRNLGLNDVWNIRVGLSESTAYSDLFKRWYPGHTHAVEYESTDAAFRAIEKGEVDMVMSSSRWLLSLTNYQEITGYKANIVFNRTSESVFGLNKDHAALASIIDKAMKFIDVKGISGHWLNRTYDYRGKLARAQRPWLIGVSALLLSFLILLFFMFWRKRSMGKRLEKLVDKRTAELKAATKQLSETNSRIQAVLDSMPLSVILWDREFKVFDCNEEAVQLFKLKDKQEYIDNFFRFSAEYQSDGQLSAVKGRNMVVKAFDEGRCVFEWMHHTLDGTPLPAEITLVRVNIGGEDVVVGYARDLRESNRMMQEIKEQTEELSLQTAKLKAIFDAIPDLLFVKDLNSRFVQYNKAMGEAFNCPNDILLGKNEFDGLHFPAEVADAILEYEKTILTEGRNVVIEENIPTVNGLRIYETVKVPLKQNDSIIGLIGIIRDITARKVLEREYMEQAHWYKSILDATPLPISVTDANMNWTFVNKAVEYFLGTKFEDMLGKPCSNWNAQICKSSNCGITCAKRGEKRTYFAHEGGAFQVDVEILKNLEDEVSGYIEVVQDITKIKEMEKEALSASKAKSDFLAAMSHEMRTPMNVILGVAEIQLHNETLAAETRDALEKIYSSGDLLLNIINDILDLSKIEAGKLELSLAEYSVASLINDSVNLNMMRIGSKPIEFKLSVDENTPANLYGDELRIKQVLNNLLSNAIKYTKEGSVKLSAFTENTPSQEGGPSKDNVTLVFRISDTGQGMTEDQINKMFEEYARFNLEANRTTEGTGLGMSITRNLVHMMNGEISVKSEIKKGSVFTVRIPQGCPGTEILGLAVAESLEKFKANGEKRLKRSQVVFEPMPYGKVLIVDDVESNLYVAKGLMAPYGLAIETVISGFDAIDKIKNNNVYDIVFMDHMMPKMDGIETTKKLRDAGYTQPIVALTANAVVGQSDIFLANGFDGFISKPIDVRQLNAVLKKFVRDKHQPESNESAKTEEQAMTKQTSNMPSSIDPELLKFSISDTKNFLAALKGILAKRDSFKEEDFKEYTVSVHGIKSVMRNIGEDGLSAEALKLEQAGRAKDAAVISADTPAFLDELKTLIEKFNVRD